MPAALADVVVLELATGVAGPYCGKLLADLGAQVIKVEPRGGDHIRNEYPLIEGESVFFNWLNTNKLGAAIPLEDPRIELLAGRADIIIHSERGAGADALDARLRTANPSAVVLSLTPYGRSGPRAEWETSPFTEYATGGFHYFGGDPEREPIALPGYQAEFHAGLHAGVGALAALWHARETGRGQLVEISHQEAILSDHAWLTTSWTHQGNIQRRTGSMFVPCANGFVYLFNLVPYPNLFILIERFDLLEDEELQNPLSWVARFGEVLDALRGWAAARTKEEIYHAAQELRIAVSPVNNMADVAVSAQLEARGWFGEVEASGVSFKATGFPYRLSETPCFVHSHAPALGEHTSAVLAPSFHWVNAGVSRPRPLHTGPGPGNMIVIARGTQPPPPDQRGPLAGLRIIEITANWAGPISGRHFADLGADVIKIELQTKPATRALIYVADDLWPEHYHRSGYFNKLNRNKRAICLDLSKPRGREVFLRLAEKADAVIENNAARVMGQLGLAHEALREANPGIIMCSMSGYGSTGPERDYSAYGSNIETASGLASLLGYGPGEYFGTGSFYADPVTGNHGAVAVLAALHARRETGRGQWIDMALLEAVSPFFAQQFLDYTVSGRVPEPIGNRAHDCAPQGIYQTAGSDCWVAITVRDEHDFAGLGSVIGREDLAGDDGLQAVEGRRARHDELDEAIRAWAMMRDHLRASEELQAVGVPAAPVMPNWEIFSDNHLNDRGFFVQVRHPHAGTHGFPGFPWRFQYTRPAIWRNAPLFAQHNQEVFTGLLGLSEAEVQALYAEGVTADHPVYAAGPAL